MIFAIRFYFEKICIEDNKVIKSFRYPTRTYEINFNEIAMIVDDDMSTLGMNMHVYHLIPKEGVKKNFKRFTIHGGIEDRTDLLSEIVSRVGPDTQIEQSVLDLVEEYKRKK